MIVERKSPFTGDTHRIDLPVTAQQVEEWNAGEKLIQDVFPNLTRGQREYIKSGVTEEEWASIFSPGTKTVDEEDEEDEEESEAEVDQARDDAQRSADERGFP
jgi:hypothetical protein